MTEWRNSSGYAIEMPSDGTAGVSAVPVYQIVVLRGDQIDRIAEAVVRKLGAGQ